MGRRHCFCFLPLLRGACSEGQRCSTLVSGGGGAVGTDTLILLFVLWALCRGGGGGSVAAMCRVVLVFL